MAVVTFQRPPRQFPPPTPVGEVQILPPPSAPPRRIEGPQWWLVLPAVVAVLSALGLLLTSDGGSPLQLTAGLLFAASTLLLVDWYIWVVGWGRGRRIAARRTSYLRHLAEVRRQVRFFAAAQRSAEIWIHPDPRALLSLIRTSRLWERRPADPDFGCVRLGVGDRPLSVGLHPPVNGATPGQVDPVVANILGRLVRAHSTVPTLPVVLPLRSLARVRLEGDVAACRRMATAVLLQAVSWHAPTEFRIALCADEDGLAAWDWLKWVPHLADPSVPPTDLPRFAVARTLPGVEALLGDELADRPWAEAGRTGLGHILVIVDGGLPGGRRLADVDGVQGVTVVDVRGSLESPAASRLLRLRVTADDVLAVIVDDAGRESITHLGSPDQAGSAEAAATARGLAAVRLVDDDADHPLWPATSLAEVIGVADPRALNTNRLWRPRPDQDRLRVAIGVDMTGQAVDIDLKDAARGGMGPHGLVAGATGSGKSELLRTIVLGLAITHPSDYLNFLLVDVAGQGSFTALAGLPHTAAVIDGLAEPGLVTRLITAIDGELHRRRELLRDTHLHRAGQPSQPPSTGTAAPDVPDLLIVLDDCDALLAAQPALRRKLTEIGRAGDPLGVHLLLSVQDPAVVAVDGLDPHLTYRIALRTGTVEESRLVIGTGAAGHLPGRPGVGYLAADDDRLVRFTAAWVSGPLRARSATGGRSWVEPQSFRLAAAVPEESDDDPTLLSGAVARSITAREPMPAGRRRSLIDVAVAQLTGSGVPAHEVWLPPLGESPTLDQLLPRAAVQPRGPGQPGHRSAANDPASLLAPLGWVDRPFDQSRDLLTLDLSGSAGAIAVVGAAGSGKSTALHSLICVLALSHPPHRVQVYCLDFGAGNLGSLLGLPHVGAVADRTEPERVRRLIATLTTVIAGREATRAAVMTNPTEGAARRFDDGFGDLVVVVDGWDAFAGAMPSAAAQLLALAVRGRRHHCQLIVSAESVPPARGTLDDLIGTHIELRQVDPAQSRIDPALSAMIPRSQPGRGLTSDRLQLLTALPRIDAKSTTVGLAGATGELVSMVADRWPGQAAPAVKVLPEVVRPVDLPAHLDPGLGYPIGLDEDLEPVLWNPQTDQHLMIFGAKQSGKTTVLRRLVQQIAARHGLDDARFILLDGGRQLIDPPRRPHQVIATATTAAQAADVITAAAARLRDRLPAPSMSWEDIAGRRWWGSSADIYLIVDNYEGLAAGAPLAQLVPLLSRSPDIALHLLIAREAAGGSQAMSEPVYTTLRDVGAPALMLSGPATEGIIYGRTRVANRPAGRGIWVPRRGDDVLIQAILDPQEW